MQDKITWKILEDGTISITTDAISGQNHLSADKLLKSLFEAVGGEVTTSKRKRMNAGLDLRGALEAHTHDGHHHNH